MKEQIDEKTKIISDICPFYKEYGTCEQCNTELDIDDPPCYFECMANAIINNGYRKQSEWISVEERLPKRREKCLCYYPQKDYGSKVVVDYAETDDGYFAEQYQFGAPSHWMPLPKPPKMKGGE